MKAMTNWLNFYKEASKVGLERENLRVSQVGNSFGGMFGFIHKGGAVSISFLDTKSKKLDTSSLMGRPTVGLMTCN